MQKQPFFSICIPVYKNIQYLDRLLQSIIRQTFSDFEIVVTDDSPDDAVEIYLSHNYPAAKIAYYKNPVALGTPENWNEGIRRATGEWIKIMHDDDWFATNEALQLFANAIQQDKDCSFFFSAFQNVDISSGKIDQVRMRVIDKWMLKTNVNHLFTKVYVGNPSCTVIKRGINLFYDKRYKFIVDFEYYIRCINKTKKYLYIDEILISVGFNDEQVTGYTKFNPAVQIPENHLVLSDLGVGILKDIFVFDYYWRLYRNINIRSLEFVHQYYDGELLPISKYMLLFQSRIPTKLLNIGVLSKLCMTVCYIICRLKF